MEKRVKKVSINLTQEQYDTLCWVADAERRSISELAALIVIDTTQMMFIDKQPKGTWERPKFIAPNKEKRNG